jgi:hypothetical protein
MQVQQAQSRPAETIRKAAELALNDAIEIRQLIALMRTQNAGDVNKRLTEARAGRARTVVQNALLARLYGSHDETTTSAEMI